MSLPGQPTPATSPPQPDPNPSADRERWFREKIHSQEGHLKAYLRSAYPGVRDVEDVIQESYLRIWKAKAWNEILSAKAFLFRVARNVAVDAVRANLRSPTDSLGDLSLEHVLDDKATAAEAADESEKMILLADAVLSLPARCRKIILLRKIHGLSQKEVGAKLGLSERTVENQCRIGVRRCEQYLRRRGMKNFLGDEL